MIYGLVLASGLSRRMGRDKLLLPWQGISLIEHTVANIAQTSLDELFIVTSKKRLGYLKKTNHSPIFNQHPHLGMGHSLALGVRHLPPTTDAVVVILGDQPEIAADDITQVIQLFKKYQDDKIIIQTEYSDGKLGHPILFSRHFFADLSMLHGDIGGRGIIQDHVHYVVRHQSRNTYPADIDTVDDYEKLLNRVDNHLPLIERRYSL